MSPAEIFETPKAVLAPIAGFSDVGFRRLCARAGAALTYTEMISAKGLVYGSVKTEDLLHTTDAEKVKAVQIFGREPEIMLAAARHQALAKFDIVDVNMGCPVPKIVGNGEGSALLKEPELAAKIVRTLKLSGKFVSVKFRIGFEQNSRTGVDFAKILQDAGADALTVHGRTREQFYSGIADREYIAEVVRAVDIPVLANGDVDSVDDFREMLRITGAAGVMIARGALGCPWLFADIAGIERPWRTRREAVDEHIATMLEFHSPVYVAANMKKHLAYYVKGLTGGKAFKQRVFESGSVKELQDAVRECELLDIPIA